MDQQTSNHSWDIPQRQSPAAIFILLLQTAVTLIKAFWFVIVIFIFKRKDSDGDTNYLWFILGFAVLTIIGSIIKYWFIKFHISNENLIITSGWLKKKTVTMPLKNIQAVHLEQNIWQQLLKVARLSLDGAGTEKIEVKLDALAIHKAEELRQILLPHEAAVIEETLQTETPGNVFRLSTTDLLKLSLSANHLEAFFILFGVGINLLDDLRKIFNIDGWEMMGDYAGRLQEQKIVAISVLIILVALISTGISMVRTILKYYDFKLAETIHGWRVQYGLINRQQMLIPFNKIQILSWRSNLIRRKMDFWMLHVQSIGHDETKQKQHLRIPVIRLSQVLSLSRAYQHSPVFEPSTGNVISDTYFKRRILVVTIPASLILTVILYMVTGTEGLWGMLLLPLMSWYYYKWNRNFRWQQNEEGIQLYSGVWGRRYSLLTWKKIQQLEMGQSIYQQKKRLGTLKFVTAGGELKLPYIDAAVARDISDKVLFYVESRNEGWM